MALTQATKEAMWIKFFLTELGVFNSDGIPINVDNQSCVALAKSPSFMQGPGHPIVPLIRESGRQVREAGVLPTDQMVADVMTKALPLEKHQWAQWLRQSGSNVGAAQSINGMLHRLSKSLGDNLHREDRRVLLLG